MKINIAVNDRKSGMQYAMKEPFQLAEGKVKAVPLQAWSGPDGSRKLRFPDFRDNGTGWW